MKKVISIVLSLAMVICLMPTMAFAAEDVATATATVETPEFADASSIQYTEAVEVLVAIGVLDGIKTASGTEFKPTGDVTREQAAKIISTLLLGEEDAEKLVAEKAPFEDVAADRWSAGYIAYGVEEGFIAGVGDNKFNPQGNVTADQFAKMLLVAIGYDADQAGLVGSAWVKNTEKLAKDAGLFVGDKKVEGSAPATREEAALYAYNTLKAPLVEYDSAYANIKSDLFTVTGLKATKVEADVDTKGAEIEYGTIEDDGYVEFAEEHYPDLVFDRVDAEFAYPADNWKYEKEEIGTYVDEAAYVAEGSVDLEDAIDELGEDATIVEAYVNGAKVKDFEEVTLESLSDDKNFDEADYNGANIKLFATDTKDEYIACEILGNVGQVEIKDVDATKKVGAHTEYTLSTVDGEALDITGDIFSSVVDEDKDVTTTVVKGDVEDGDTVMYVVDESEATEISLYIQELETVDGVVSKYSSKTQTATIGDKAVEKHVNAVAAPKVGKSEVSWYVDPYGYYVAQKQDEVADGEYGFVLSADVSYKTSWKTVNGKAQQDIKFDKGTATVVKFDGTVEEIDLLNADAASLEDKLVKFSLNEKKGLYKVEALEEENEDIKYELLENAEIEKDLTTVGSMKANKKTLYIVADYEENPEYDEDDAAADADYDVAEKIKAGTVTTFTGYKNVEDMAAANGYVVNVASKGSFDTIAEVVYVYAHEDAAAVSENVLVLEAGDETADGVEYSVAIDGKLDSLTSKAALEAGTLYESIKGTEAKSVAPTVTGAKVQNNGGLLMINDDEIKAADDVPVYIVNATDSEEITAEAKTVVELEDADALENATVWVVKNAKDEVAKIYIYIPEASEVA